MKRRVDQSVASEPSVKRQFFESLVWHMEIHKSSGTRRDVIPQFAPDSREQRPGQSDFWNTLSHLKMRLLTKRPAGQAFRQNR